MMMIMMMMMMSPPDKIAQCRTTLNMSQRANARLACSLKGLRHASLASFKIQNMSCPQLNSKNNGLGLLFKTTL